MKNPRRAAVGLGLALSVEVLTGCNGIGAEPEQELPSFIAEDPKGPIFDLAQSREDPTIAIDEGDGIITEYYYSPDAGGYANTYAAVFDGQTGMTDSIFLGQMFCDEGEFRMYIPFDMSAVTFGAFDQVEFDQLSAATCTDNVLSESDLSLWLAPPSTDSLAAEAEITGVSLASSRRLG